MILLALAFLVSAQQQSIARTVLATILNQRNQPIVDLETDDFVVRESGQPQEVLSVRIADYPVAILIDNSAGSGADLEAMKVAAARFMTRVGDRPIAVGTLGPSAALLSSFTDERAISLARVNAIAVEAGPAQTVAGMAAAAAHIRASTTPFASIVVLSASAVPEGEASTALLAAILDSRAIVHVVVHTPSPRAPVRDDLRRLTSQSRGQFTSIFSAASFQVALDHLADQMAAEMMIDYMVPGNAPPKEDVTVGVRRPGARVVGMGVR